MSKNKNNDVLRKENVKFDKKTHADYLRDNVRKYMYDNDITLTEFAEKAEIPYNTMQSIIYKKSDCRLETAIAIAKAIGIGVDELANTGALPDKSLESILITRSLPNRTIELIRRYIRWQKTMYEYQEKKHGKYIDVMNLDYSNDCLWKTDDIEKVDISDFSDKVKSIVFLGVKIPCNEYIQFYAENDILLLSDERKPIGRERAVILYYNRVIIAQRDIVNNVYGYRGIRSSTAFIPDDEVEYYFGYVVAVKHN